MTVIAQPVTIYSIRQVEAFIDRNDFKNAIPLCREFNRKFPDSINGWHQAIRIHVAHKKYDLVKAVANIILNIDDNDTRALLSLSDACSCDSELEAARDALHRLSRLSLTDAQLCDEIAIRYTHLGDHEKARHSYERSLKLAPKTPDRLYNLATCYRFLGLLNEAYDALSEAIAIDPDDSRSLALRSNLKKATVDNNHIIQLTGAIDNAKTVYEQIDLKYALFKEYDDLGDCGRAFEALDSASRAKRKQMNYSVEDDERNFAKIADIYHTHKPLEYEPLDGPTPIFIVGMPRTGTTLVEQVLQSHENITSAGELDHFGRLLGEQLSNGLESADNICYEKLREHYLAKTQIFAKGADYYVDKLPLNFLYVGAIKRAIPEAKVIHLCRAPMATCFANFKQLFGHAYPYSYNLEDLGRYYVAYRKLMTHWYSLYPCLISVEYEQFVAHFEGEAKKLIARLGLIWNDSCLRFYEQTNAVTTASAEQVRRPVYRTSIDGYLKYAPMLTPLTQHLSDNSIDPYAW